MYQENSKRCHKSAGLSERPLPLEIERRAVRRVILQLPIEIRRDSPFDSEPICARVRNVSTKGAFFCCDSRFYCGEPLRITFCLPAEGTGNASEQRLTFRYRIQRFEEACVANHGKFGIAVALDD